MKESLFMKATDSPRRLKMYIFGETGTGKTTTALHFPSPAVIDTEYGTEYYGKFFDFDVIHTSSFQKIDEAVDFLIENPKKYKTLVIDSFSNVYDQMIIDHQTYLRKKRGNPTYEITGLDYRPIKTQIKKLVGRLNDLDVNIVITARSKDIYSNEPSEFMKKIGTAPDGPKDLPNMFDVVMEITVDRYSDEAVPKRTAVVYKDRTNTLPPTFEFTYQKLTEYFGIEDLEREPVKFNKNLKNLSGRNTVVKFGGKEIRTAGVTAEQLKTLSEIEEKAKKVGKTDEIMEILAGDYSVASFLDLRKDEADLFISDVTSNLS